MQLDAAWFRRNEPRIIGGIVLLSAVLGILFIHAVPPWQHYDEPMHFEYAWLIADRGELPEPEEYDWEFRTELARSMIEHDFYAGLREPVPGEFDPLPAGFQYPQLDDPPLFYLLASIPIRLAGSADLAGQLIAARYTSLLLLVLTVFSTWGIMRELTPPGSVYRFLVPLTVAMLPSFVDLMTAVNNDVGAVAVFTLFLWGAVRLIQAGPTPLNLLWVVLLAAAGVYTKSTAYLAVPLGLIAIVLSLLPGRLRRFAWGLVVLGLAAGLFGLLIFNEPAYWYRASSQTEPIRAEYAGAPDGGSVLVVDPSARITPRWLRAVNQPIPPGQVGGIAGRPLTLGFWMWFSAEDPGVSELTARSPAVNIDVPRGEDPSAWFPLTLSRDPQFFAFTVPVPENAIRLWVSMDSRLESAENGVKLYYDGLVLAEGSHATEIAAVLNPPDAVSGQWNGVPYANLLRNGSAEETWPAFRPEADNLASAFLPSNVRLTILLYSVLDREGASWYYAGAARNIFETFWGRFGWGHVPLPAGEWIYGLASAAVVLAVVGAVFYPYRKGGRVPVDALLFIVLVFLVVWFAALARGALFIFVESVFQPSARYGFPAIAPTVLLLLAGWVSIGKYLRQLVPIPRFYLVFIYIDMLVMLDVLALLGISIYYAGV